MSTSKPVTRQKNGGISTAMTPGSREVKPGVADEARGPRLIFRVTGVGGTERESGVTGGLSAAAGADGTVGGTPAGTHSCPQEQRSAPCSKLLVSTLLGSRGVSVASLLRGGHQRCCSAGDEGDPALTLRVTSGLQKGEHGRSEAVAIRKVPRRLWS